MVAGGGATAPRGGLSRHAQLPHEAAPALGIDGARAFAPEVGRDAPVAVGRPVLSDALDALDVLDALDALRRWRA